MTVIDLERIQGKKLALLLLRTDAHDREESVCILGRIAWDGRRLRADIDHGQSFAVPLDKLDRVRRVPAELRTDLDGAELYVTLLVASGHGRGGRGAGALAVVWPE